MGLPSIVIRFKEAGITAIKRGQRGIVALILRDAVPAKNPAIVYTPTDIPAGLTDANVEQINLCLMGYQTPPKKVLVYVIPADSKDYSAAQKALEGMRWDYVVVPEIKPAETTTFATWIKALRDTKDIKVKAVLPNEPSDHEGVVNFATAAIVTKAKTYNTAQYCSRIAGMLAGTPMIISATFAPLPEVLDCDRMARDEMDAAIDAGKMMLYNDGEKIKIARAVNSFVTTIQGKLDSFKKCKLIDAMDMIHDDIKKTAEDSYLGKYANSYDNKCLLISAIQGYFDQLVLDGILDPGKNNVFIDVEQQRVWLKSTGVAVENMKEQEIKEANTKDKVFLAANIKILDAIEDITFGITI